MRRFGLHLAAAVGATGIFVAAAAVGAHQTQPSGAPAAVVSPVARSPVARPTPEQREPGAVAQPTPTPALGPERSVAGTIRELQPDAIVVQGVGGRVWRVEPAQGALIRLNGKTTPLDTLAAGDAVVILGQAESGPGGRFLAHAVTARRT
ncbi:MAG: hypothetical protein JOY61_21880 [Chloroflexi bacterium]|nr:hypothetical protein [Chloroflexota bacterium]